jgi:hypothetical protein
MDSGLQGTLIVCYAAFMLRSVPVESPMFIVLKGCGQIAGLKSCWIRIRWLITSDLSVVDHVRYFMIFSVYKLVM